MDNKEAASLIKKYLEGTTTPQEVALLESWYIITAEKQPDKPGKVDYVNIEHEILIELRKEQLPRPRPLWPRIIAAASILLFISVGGYFVLYKNSSPQIVSKIFANNDIKPGTNKATLTLANGQKIILDNAHNGKLAQQGNTVIKSTNGQIFYSSSVPERTAVIIYNTLTTKPGEQYPVVLADGTKVWLNAESSITYPVAFSGNERKVTITGEAYFEVSHNAAKPFRVKSKGQTVEVLGTHFNINAYNDEDVVKTTLLEGKVKVNTNNHEAVLEPGQQSRVDVDESNLGIFKGIENVDTEEAIAWKNGHFQFEKADIKTVMRQLARWYNVDVIYSGPVRPRLFSGSISRDLNASEALEALSYEGVHFTIEGNKIIVSP